MQYSLEEKYEVGHTAVIYCNVTKDKETVRSCTMIWKVQDENSNNRVAITDKEKYNKRVNGISENYFSSLTISDLSLTDTEKILCTATCFVDDKLRYMTGNWTVITLTGALNIRKFGILCHFFLYKLFSFSVLEKEPTPALPWLKYLIFSINLLIFTVALGICVLIVRRMKRRK